MDKESDYPPIVAVRRYLRGEISYEAMRAAEAAWDPYERAAWLMRYQRNLVEENARLHARLKLYEGEPTNMTIYVQSHRGDGTSVIADAADGQQFVIKTKDWPVVGALPNEEQRAKLEELHMPEHDSQARESSKTRKAHENGK